MLLCCTGDQGSVKVLKSKNSTIANLLGVTAQGGSGPLTLPEHLSDGCPHTVFFFTSEELEGLQ